MTNTTRSDFLYLVQTWILAKVARAPTYGSWPADIAAATEVADRIPEGMTAQHAAQDFMVHFVEAGKNKNSNDLPAWMMRTE